MPTLQELHVGSIFVGLGLAGLLFGLTSFDHGNGQGSDRVQRISLDPDPTTIVRIVEGQPFTVPHGQILVIKSVGEAAGSGIGSARVLVNNSPVLSTSLITGAPITLGFPVTAAAGEVVTVEDAFGPDPNTSIVVGGYLASER